MLQLLMEALFERYQQEMPEEFCKKENCRVHKDYDKNSEECKECYAAGKLKEFIFKLALEHADAETLERIILSKAKHATVRVVDEDDEELPIPTSTEIN